MFRIAVMILAIAVMVFGFTMLFIHGQGGPADYPGSAMSRGIL